MFAETEFGVFRCALLYASWCANKLQSSSGFFSGAVLRMKDLVGKSEAELVSAILRGVLPHEVLLIDRATGLGEAKAQYKQIALRLHPGSGRQSEHETQHKQRPCSGLLYGITFEWPILRETSHEQLPDQVRMLDNTAELSAPSESLWKSTVKAKAHNVL